MNALRKFHWYNAETKRGGTGIPFIDEHPKWTYEPDQHPDFHGRWNRTSQQWTSLNKGTNRIIICYNQVVACRRTSRQHLTPHKALPKTHDKQ